MISSFFRKYSFFLLSLLAVCLLVGFLEKMTGRSLYGPDGRFGFWDGDIWSNENSQRVADAYSFSHIIHGILFYGFLWLILRRIPLQYRFVLALCLE
jgi:hypothetical protein